MSSQRQSSGANSDHESWFDSRVAARESGREVEQNYL